MCLCCTLSLPCIQPLLSSLPGQVQALQEQESGFKVRLRAAEDRVAVAEGMALDMRKQCDAAAVTISRLIDENRCAVVVGSRGGAPGGGRGQRWGGGVTGRRTAVRWQGNCGWEGRWSG